MKKTLSLALACIFASYLAFAITGNSSSLTSLIKSSVSSVESMLDLNDSRLKKSNESFSFSHRIARKANANNGLGELWGYYLGTGEDLGGVGTSSVGTFAAGIVVNSDPGSLITAVNVPVLSTNTSNVSVSICAANNMNTPLVTKSVENVSIGYNTILLDEPVSIPNEGQLFVYYTFTIDSLQSNSDNYPIAIARVDTPISGSCYISIGGGWEDYYGNNWVSALQVYIASPTYNVYNENFESWTSTNHEDSSTSEYTWNLNCLPNTTLSFDYMVSSESGCDFLLVSLDGTEILYKSGEQSGNLKITISEAGSHTLKAQYSKDSSVNNGADEATVQNIKLSIAEVDSDYFKSYVQNVVEAVQGKCDLLSGFDAMIAQLETSITELNAMVDSVEDQSIIMNKVNELTALSNKALDVKDKYYQLCGIVKENKELYTVTGNVELGNAVTQAEILVNAKATLTTESLDAIENAIQAIELVKDGMNLHETMVWDFAFSQETIDGIKLDCNNYGNWSDYGNYFYKNVSGGLSQLSYQNANGWTVIPETAGLYFNRSNGRDYILYYDTNRLYTQYSGSYNAITIPALTAGQLVTINYSSSNGSSTGITIQSANAEIISGSNTTSTTAEVVYEIISDEDFTFYPTNGRIYFNSISVTVPGDLLRLAELRMEVAEYIATLDSFPGLKSELQTAYNNAVITEEEADVENIINNLKNTLNNVKKAIEVYPTILTDIESAKTALEEEAYVELSEALALGTAIDVNTSTSADYIAAFDALETTLAIYNSDKVEMADWAFNTSSVYTVDGLRYYLDTTHNLAEFINFNTSNAYSGALNIPASIRYNGTTYAVVAMINNGRYTQSNITSVTLPKSLRHIGDYGLGYFSNVRSIEIPENVTSMGSNVIYGDVNLHAMKLNSAVPSNISSLWNGSYYYNNNGSSSYYYGDRIKLTVPAESFHAYRIASVWKDNILIGGDGVTVSTGKIVAGDLGHVVLDEATYLQEVNKLIIDEGTLNNDDWNTIKSMTNLIEVDMSGVTMSSMPANAFDGRWAIESVKLPHNVTSIGDYALRGTGIKEITLPESITTLGTYAFNNCDSIRTISIPEAITTIPNYCFNDCNNLWKIELPSALTSINQYAFNNCNALSEVTLPSSLTSIGSYAFRYCPIKTIEIPAGIIAINNYSFADNSAIDSLFIPETVTTINSNAFYNCFSLKNVQFSEGLVNLYSYAFYNCKQLSEVVLPSSLERCEGAPFNNCSGIKKVEARSVIPPTTSGSCPLNNVNLNDVVLYVPSWSTSEYALAEGWSSFYTIEVSDFMPQYIKVNKDFYFTVRDSVSSDYRPNISMTYSSVESTDAYGHTNYERGNLTVSGRSKLAVNDLSLVVSPYAKFYSDYNVANGYEYDSYRTNLNSTSLIVNGEMRAENVTMSLCNYNSRWQFVTFPFDVKVSDIIPQSENTSWVIRGHNGAMRAAGKADSVWVNLTTDDVLEAGKGYIMHNYTPSTGEWSYWDDGWSSFNVTPVKNSVNRQLIFSSEDRTIELEENLAEFDHNRSWNLIGNPYPCFYDSRFMDFDAPFMVWNSYTQNYVAYNPADDAYILSPGEAFFVQRPFDQESITFRKEGRQTHRYAREMALEAPARAKAANNNTRTIFNLTLQQDTLIDRTRVVFNDGATLSYEMSRDAAKFASTEKNVPQIFTIADKTRYAINERPFANGDVALGVYCGTEGEFTISLDKTYGCKVILEDKLNNSFVELSADNSYTFSAFAGEYLNRFVLHFENDATGVDNINVDDINADDAIYNLQGIKVNSTNNKGIYIKNGQKTIIK